MVKIESNKEESGDIAEVVPQGLTQFSHPKRRNYNRCQVGSDEWRKVVKGSALVDLLVKTDSLQWLQ
ncbi:hypothetical protein Bca101_079855 [Brassica carinata]